MLKRLLTISKDQSFFLLGPRGTGKSTLLKSNFDSSSTVYFDLLDRDDFMALSLHPDEMRSRALGLKTDNPWVIVDEVQKLPELLDTVHKLIENDSIRFALTGSSARKLKKAGSNLLGGRAVIFNLFPFTYLELGKNFDLDRFLSWGGLPLVVNAPSDKQRARILKAYANTYLKEEIIQERIVRALAPFQRFLEVAAQMSGQLINYSAIASDCGISDQTVRDYFSILEDTLIGFMLPAYGKSTRKQALSSPKFYFFDCGVERALKNDLRGPLPNDRQIFGRYFESFVINQIKALSSYFELDFKLYHFRTGNGLESDLIIERPGQSPVALEIKSTELLTSTHLKAFGKTQQLLPECEHLCLSQDPNSKQFGKIRAEHWRKGIAEILGIE